MRRFLVIVFAISPLYSQTLVDWSQIRKPADLPYVDMVQTWTALQNFNAGLTATTVVVGNVSSPAGLFNGIEVPQTVVPNGGYIDFPPVTYPPYNGAVCKDYFGNIVNQPLPTNSLPAFGANDVVMWNSTSPSMPANGSCGVPLPVNLIYGLNINAYFFARGGLATDQGYYNSIQSLANAPGLPGGGVQANTFVASTLYPAGTLTACCGTLLAPANLGGHVDVGHSNGPPASGTIASQVNPLSANEGLVAGMTYFDDGLGCLQVYSGTAWLNASAPCIGGGSGGTPASPNTSIQWNSSGAFGGTANLVWNNVTNILTILGIGATLPSAAGVQAPSLTSFNTGANVGYSNNGGATTFAGIYGNGQVDGQWLALTNQSGPPTPQSGSSYLYSTSTGLYLSLNGGSYNQLGTVNSIYCTGTGTNTITCPGVPVPTSYTNGMEVTLLAGGTNTGATTLNINSLGAIAVLSGGSALSASTLVSGNVYTVYYSSTGPAFNLASSVGGVTSFNTRTGGVTLVNADVTTAVGQNLNMSGTPIFSTVGAVTLNCTATSTTACVTQNTATFEITGAGNAAFQSTALALLSSAITGTGGGTSVGNAYLSATTAGLYLSLNGGTPTLVGSGICPGSGLSGYVLYTTGSACASSSNFTYNNSTGVLTVGAGGSAPAMVAPTVACTATSTALCVTQASQTFAITGEGNAAFQSTALSLLSSATTGTGGGTGVGNAYLSATTAGLYVSVNGATPILLNGGSGSPAGLNTYVQYNNMGAFGANSAFTFNSGTGVLTAPILNCTATGSALCVTQGTGTFTITGAGNSAFQSTALALLASASTGLGGGTGVGNALLSATTTGLYASINGGTPILLGSSSGCPTGSIGYVQYTTGSACASTANFTYNSTTGQLTIGSGGSAPAMIAPALQSTCNTGGCTAVNNSGNSFYILGNGAGNFASLLTNSLTVNGSYGINGSGVVTGSSFSGTSMALTGGLTVDMAAYGFNGSGALSASTLSATGTLSVSTTSTFTGAAAFNGGFTTGSSTSSYLYVGSSGNFYNRPLSTASTAVSCGGVQDGWMAVSNDDYLVICLGGARFRSLLSSF